MAERCRRLSRIVALCQAATSFAGAPPPQFNNTQCPSSHELQAPHVAADFRPEFLEGFFYELAFHDYMQWPLCPLAPRCITSSKRLQRHPDGAPYVNDTWNIQCCGKVYSNGLFFNLTSEPGFMRGYWPTASVPYLPKNITRNVVYPDTVVDFKPGPDGWLLELQCISSHGRVLYVGINFYSKTKDERNFHEIEAAARARGLGFWMDRGLGLTRVDHSNCSGEPPPPASGAGGRARRPLGGRSALADEQRSAPPVARSVGGPGLRTLLV